jgi:hypothetical protein|nr:MAG TPA: hypothetical protein [Caudoviricetes sp.]
MKVLGLIEQDLDIVSKEYVDNKVKEVSKAGEIVPEGKIKLDLATFAIALNPDADYKEALGGGYIGFLMQFLSSATDVEGTPITQKHNTYLDGSKESIYRLLKDEPVIYVEEETFDAVISYLNSLSPLKLDEMECEGKIKIDLSALYAMGEVIALTAPNGMQIDRERWMRQIIARCTFPYLQEGESIDITKDLKAIISEHRKAYISKEDYDVRILLGISGFSSIGKDKGYELMKTHYAIYLFSLAHKTKHSSLGQNQQFFKLIKDGYSPNEYDARKTLVNDLGFEYNESAPESSYSIDALSNFADKHPEIYVPTAFTDYVKGTAGGTMEIVGAVTNMMEFYETHKNDPKIKILTENEYRFLHNRDANTLYIVREN